MYIHEDPERYLNIYLLNHPRIQTIFDNITLKQTFPWKDRESISDFMFISKKH